MKTEQNKRFTDRMIDDMLRRAVLQRCDNEEQEIKKMIEQYGKPKLSKEHKKKMKEIFESARKPKPQNNVLRPIRINKWTVHAALLAVLLLTMITVEGFRVPIINALFGNRNDYSIIDYVQDDEFNRISEEIPAGMDGIYIVDPLPAGYNYDFAVNEGRSFMTKYSTDDGRYVILKQRPIQKAKQTVNAEKGKQIDINGVKGTIYESDTDIILLWEENNTRFTITSNEKQGVIVTFAQNIIFRKKL